MLFVLFSLRSLHAWSLELTLWATAKLLTIRTNATTRSTTHITHLILLILVVVQNLLELLVIILVQLYQFCFLLISQVQLFSHTLELAGYLADLLDSVHRAVGELRAAMHKLQVVDDDQAQRSLLAQTAQL